MKLRGLEIDTAAQETISVADLAPAERGSELADSNAPTRRRRRPRQPAARAGASTQASAAARDCAGVWARRLDRLGNFTGERPAAERLVAAGGSGPLPDMSTASAQTRADRASAPGIRALGAVHRAIGAAQHVIGAVVGSEDGDADARAGDDVVSLDVRGLTRELPLERRGDVGGAVGVGVRQEDGELVAAEAREDVARPQALRDDVADVLEQLIAGVMSKRVVDGLEVVEVQY